MLFNQGKGTAKGKRTWHCIKRPKKVEKASHKYAILKYFGYVVWGIVMDDVPLCKICLFQSRVKMKFKELTLFSKN